MKTEKENLQRKLIKKSDKETDR